MTKLLYNVLLHLALPWAWARLFLKARREPAYRARIGERFGAAPSLPEGVVWFHAVSAGETIAAAPLVRAVRRRLPHLPLLVTSMTPTGAGRAAALLGDVAANCYAPYDYPWAVARFLRRVKPRALVLLETELWPNLIEQAAGQGVPVYLVNARLSLRAYRRYRRIAWLMRPTLRRLAHVACQYEDTSARFRALGAERVTAIGNVKFDAPPAPDRFGVKRLKLGDAPAWIAGSTHPGEEEIVLDAHLRLLRRHPALRLILVPRHAERAEAVAVLVRERGLAPGFLSERPAEFQVLIGDVMGTLAHLYALARAALIGGTLDDTGGHNPIEAAVCGVPMLVGPACFKIEEVCSRFFSGGCMHLVRDAVDIERVVAALLDDPTLQASEAALARRVVAENRGAQAALTAMLTQWLGTERSLG